MAALQKRFPIRFQPPHRAPFALRYFGVQIFIIDPFLLDWPTFDLGDCVKHFDRLGRELGHGVVVRFDEKSLRRDGFDEFLVIL